MSDKDKKRGAQVVMLKPGEKMPKGAIQIHFGRFENVLRGRLQEPCAKGSLAADILERLESAYESWTDPKYGDNPEVLELRDALLDNAADELQMATDEFLSRHPELTPDAVPLSGPSSVST